MTVFRFLNPDDWDGMEVVGDQVLQRMAASRKLHFEFRDDGVYEMTLFCGAKVAEIVDVVDAVLFKVGVEAILRDTLSVLEGHAEQIRKIVRQY